MLRYVHACGTCGLLAIGQHEWRTRDAGVDGKHVIDRSLKVRGGVKRLRDEDLVTSAIALRHHHVSEIVKDTMALASKSFLSSICKLQCSFHCVFLT